MRKEGSNLLTQRTQQARSKTHLCLEDLPQAVDELLLGYPLALGDVQLVE